MTTEDNTDSFSVTKDTFLFTLSCETAGVSRIRFKDKCVIVSYQRGVIKSFDLETESENPGSVILDIRDVPSVKLIDFGIFSGNELCVSFTSNVENTSTFSVMIFNIDTKVRRVIFGYEFTEPFSGGTIECGKVYSDPEIFVLTGKEPLKANVSQPMSSLYERLLKICPKTYETFLNSKPRSEIEKLEFFQESCTILQDSKLTGSMHIDETNRRIFLAGSDAISILEFSEKAYDAVKSTPVTIQNKVLDFAMHNNYPLAISKNGNVFVIDQNFAVKSGRFKNCRLIQKDKTAVIYEPINEGFAFFSLSIVETPEFFPTELENESDPETEESVPEEPADEESEKTAMPEVKVQESPSSSPSIQLAIESPSLNSNVNDHLSPLVEPAKETIISTQKIPKQFVGISEELPNSLEINSRKVTFKLKDCLDSDQVLHMIAAFITNQASQVSHVRSTIASPVRPKLSLVIINGDGEIYIHTTPGSYHASQEEAFKKAHLSYQFSNSDGGVTSEQALSGKASREGYKCGGHPIYYDGKFCGAVGVSGDSDIINDTIAKKVISFIDAKTDCRTVNEDEGVKQRHVFSKSMCPDQNLSIGQLTINGVVKFFVYDHKTMHRACMHDFDSYSSMKSSINVTKRVCPKCPK